MNTSILPQLYQPTITIISPLQVFDARTPDQQWFDGFHQFADCVRDGDYLTNEEIAAMPPNERKGYNDAISAADYSEWAAYAVNANSFCDLTEW